MLHRAGAHHHSQAGHRSPAAALEGSLGRAALEGSLAPGRTAAGGSHQAAAPDTAAAGGSPGPLGELQVHRHRQVQATDNTMIRTAIGAGKVQAWACMT